MIIRTYPFGWLTPFVIDDISQNPDQLGLYLQLSRLDWHYAGLALAIAQKRPNQAAHYAWLRANLFTERRQEILGVLGVEAPKRLVKLLPKLSGRPWQPASYRRLAALSADEETCKFLQHRRRLQRRDILQISRLPAGFRNAVLFVRLQKGWKSDEIRFAIQIVRSIRPDLDDRKILSSLKNFEGHSLSDWVARYYRQLPFPPCPWEGTDQLQPLRSFDQLKRTAREFSNCIRTYLTKILRGNAFFYRYEEDGKGVAVIEVVNMPAIGWIMNEALGPCNDALSPEVQKRIEAALAGGDITVPPATIEPEHWLAA